MPRAARAKQFMPFAALGGLEEALRLREQSAEERAALDEEEIEKIDRILRRLCVGDETRLVFFYKGHYTPVNGVVQCINEQRQYLELDGKRIYFEDILKFG
jgi:hypothetical protein